MKKITLKKGDRVFVKKINGQFIISWKSKNGSKGYWADGDDKMLLEAHNIHDIIYFLSRIKFMFGFHFVPISEKYPTMEAAFEVK
jgi:signal peptidase I